MNSTMTVILNDEKLNFEQKNKETVTNTLTEVLSKGWFKRVSDTDFVLESGKETMRAFMRVFTALREEQWILPYISEWTSVDDEGDTDNVLSLLKGKSYGI